MDLPRYQDKEFWSPANLPQIAEDLGYVLTPRFSQALEQFIRTKVEIATVTLFLRVVAQNYLESITPPLEKSRPPKIYK